MKLQGFFLLPILHQDIVDKGPFLILLLVNGEGEFVRKDGIQDLDGLLKSIIVGLVDTCSDSGSDGGAESSGLLAVDTHDGSLKDIGENLVPDLASGSASGQTHMVQRKSRIFQDIVSSFSCYWSGIVLTLSDAKCIISNSLFLTYGR